MNIELESMAIEMPVVVGHPNRDAFRGVLTLVDVASDKRQSRHQRLPLRCQAVAQRRLGDLHGRQAAQRGRIVVRGKAGQRLRGERRPAISTVARSAGGDCCSVIGVFHAQHGLAVSGLTRFRPCTADLDAVMVRNSRSIPSAAAGGTMREWTFLGARRPLAAGHGAARGTACDDEAMTEIWLSVCSGAMATMLLVLLMLHRRSTQNVRALRRALESCVLWWWHSDAQGRVLQARPGGAASPAWIRSPCSDRFPATCPAPRPRRRVCNATRQRSGLSS